MLSQEEAGRPNFRLDETFPIGDPSQQYIFERTVMGQQRQLDVGFVGDVD
jgi:hypothetical protein